MSPGSLRKNNLGSDWIDWPSARGETRHASLSRVEPGCSNKLLPKLVRWTGKTIFSTKVEFSAALVIRRPLLIKPNAASMLASLAAATLTVPSSRLSAVSEDSLQQQLPVFVTTKKDTDFGLI